MIRQNTLVPSAIGVIRAIAKVTFLEILQDKVLYNIFLCSALLLALQWLASRLAAIHPERVVLDFGLAAVSLSGTFMGLLIGAGLLSKEIKNRTYHVALCRPITKTQFVIGKFAGLSLVLCLNWLILSSVYLLMLLAESSQSAHLLINSTLLVAIGLSLIQSFLVASWSLFFSSFSTTSISVVLATGLYLIGSNISQLKLVALRAESYFGRHLLKILATLLPNFEFFQLGTKVTYGLPISFRFVCQSIGYGGMMMILTLGLAGMLVQIREE